MGGRLYCQPWQLTLIDPPTENELRQAQDEQVLRAPVRARVAIPVQLMPNLITALQEHMRVYSESFAQQPEWKAPIH